MKYPRRQFLRLAAGAVGLPLISRVAMTENKPTPPQSEAAQRPLAERLATYAHGLRYNDLDEATIERVKSHLIDSLGCGIAAFDERPVRICREIALATRAGTSTVIGTNRRATPDLAAFANGAAFRYYDLNDVYVGRFTGHPSDHIAACLAVAEAERASIAELITAIALAYEINCRLIDALDIAARGWDPPVLSLPAVALAAGKLMKLPPDKLVQAVNLAINDHIPMGQTRAQANSDWKGLAEAWAQRDFCRHASALRYHRPGPIFEGRKGFFQLVSGPADVDVGAFGRRGVPFHPPVRHEALSGGHLRSNRDRGRHHSFQGSGRPQSCHSDRNRNDPPGLRADGGMREMGAGYQGYRRSQSALHNGARHVRWR